MITERTGTVRSHNCLYSAHGEPWLQGSVVAGVGTCPPGKPGGFSLASPWSSKQGGWQARVGIARGTGANLGVECGLSTERRLRPWAVLRAG